MQAQALLMWAAEHGLAICAGAGVTHENAAALVQATGTRGLHGSCREVVRSAMAFRPDVPVPMGGEKTNAPDTEFVWKEASASKVAALAAALSKAAMSSGGSE